ncbi:MAG: galactokinase [Elusimicrobia bacterium]|nr:galactokinase [Elusimicrobiota bacterium]
MIVVRAPLRIPLGGGGTDFPSFYTKHGGFLISMAINKYVHVILNRSPVDKMIRLRYAQSEVVTKLDEIQHTVFRETLRSAGINNSVEIVSLSDAAPGTGLGSSGSFTVALLYALHRFRKQTPDPYSLAEEAYEIESARAGLPVGKQDQYMAAFGGVSCIDFEPSGKITVSALKLDPRHLEELASYLLLFYTNIQRKSFSIALQQDKDTERGSKTVIDSLQNTKRIGWEIKKSLEQRQFERIGELMHEHWENKKKRSNEMSTSSIDEWYQIARNNGAIGGKLIGSGGGGFLLLCCPPEARNKVRGALAKEGLLEMDYAVDKEGAKVLIDD